MRRFARVDDNQKAIAEALRKVGASVQFLHREGKGCPDLLVGYKRRNYLFEVKNPNALRGKAQARRLTPDEERWHAGWAGQVATIETLQQALDVLNVAAPAMSQRR